MNEWMNERYYYYYHIFDCCFIYYCYVIVIFFIFSICCLLYFSIIIIITHWWIYMHACIYVCIMKHCTVYEHTIPFIFHQRIRILFSLLWNDCYLIFLNKKWPGVFSRKKTLMEQILANGIYLGSQYAMIALGLTLIFALMNVLNFAHVYLILSILY